MILQDKNGFVFPDFRLSSLPTGAVKQLVNKLGGRIANGAYAVGENMPMEPELVAEHGVSRTVVREAIKVLSGKGLVRTARRYGTHVCDVDEWNLLDPDVISWHEPDSPMAQRIFADATQFRLLIEPRAARLAAANANRTQCELLKMSADAIALEKTLSDDRMAADFAFHATILDASGSMMLRQFRGFLNAISKFSYSTGSISMPNSGSDTLVHAEVAKAIMEQQPGLAEELIYQVLDAEANTASSAQPSTGTYA